MATIPSINMTINLKKGVASNQSFKNTLVLGSPSIALEDHYSLKSDLFEDSTNGAENKDCQFILTLNSDFKGTSDYSATDKNGNKIEDLGKAISWSQKTNGTITVVLGLDTNSEKPLPEIILSPVNESLTLFKSADGVLYKSPQELKKEKNRKDEMPKAIPSFMVNKASYKEEMLKAGFEEGDDEVLCATSYFKQNSSNQNLVVARKSPLDSLGSFLESIEDDFYSFCITSIDDEPLFKEASEYAAINEKVFVGLYTDPQLIKEEYNNNRAFFICHQDKSTRMDLSFVGEFFGREVGANSKFVELTGEKINNFSVSQVDDLSKKNMNWYQYEGFNYLSHGVLSDGTFLDEIYVIDYIKDIIKSDLLSLERKNQRIPFDATGEAMLNSTIRGSLLILARDKGLIANIESSDNVNIYSDNGKWGFILDPIKLVDAKESDKTKKIAQISMTITLSGNLKQINATLDVNL